MKNTIPAALDDLKVTEFTLLKLLVIFTLFFLVIGGVAILLSEIIMGQCEVPLAFTLSPFQPKH